MLEVSLILMVIVLIVLLFYLFRKDKNLPREDIGAIKVQTENILRTLQETYTKIETQRLVDEEIQRITKRLESALLGSKSKGEMGENILYESLKQFPPEMIDVNFKVNGKPVEYAVILSDGKRLPIDSKWIGLDDESYDVEKAIAKKAKEVSQYIDPVSTIPMAIAAVPDSVFSQCKQAHIRAYRENRVLIMPYSMTIPYILSLYSLHKNYARSLDVEKMNSYLSEIKTSISKLETLLENNIARSITMVNNAYNESRQILYKIRGAIDYIENSNKMEEKDGEKNLQV
ncbi:MAG: DNA recombination protein RmuC [bacterium]|nr:DNA recombination protein RmuC [bacterium]